MTLRNQSLLFNSESPMTRTTLLCAAIESVIWSYIKDKFMHVHAMTHASGDIEEAILQIHKCELADNSSYYAKLKGCVSGFPKYHRLPDIISLFKMTRNIHALNNDIHRINTALKAFDNNTELTVQDFIKYGKDLIEKAACYSKQLADIYEMLQWKVSHTFLDRFIYVDSADPIFKLDVRREYERYARENIRLPDGYYDFIKDKFEFYLKGKACITYKEAGLRGEAGYSSLASSIYEDILTNSRINLKELSETFEADMQNHLREMIHSLKNKLQKQREDAERHKQEQRILEEKLLACHADINFKDRKIALIETERTAAIMHASQLGDALTIKDSQLRHMQLDNMQLKKEAARPQLRIRK